MIVSANLCHHQKFLKLKKTVGIAAMHHLVSLWAHCEIDQRGAQWLEVDSAYVERVCEWEGVSGLLFSALEACRFIDVFEGRVVIHGWDERNARLLHNWRGGWSRKTQKSDQNVPYWVTQGLPLGPSQGSTQGLPLGSTLGEAKAKPRLSQGSISENDLSSNGKPRVGAIRIDQSTDIEEGVDKGGPSAVVVLSRAPTLVEVLQMAAREKLDPVWTENLFYDWTERHLWFVGGRLIDWQSRIPRFHEKRRPPGHPERPTPPEVPPGEFTRAHSSAMNEALGQ